MGLARAALPRLVKILHVIAEMDPGGAERIVLDLAADAVARGDQVEVASAGGRWVSHLERTGAHHRLVPLVGRSRLRALWMAACLVPVLRRFRPEVIHTHNVGVTVATRLAVAGTRRRPKLLTTVHGLAPEDYPAAARTLRTLAHTVVACAPAVARSLVEAGFPGPRVTVVTNGTALETADAGRRERIRVRHALGSAPLIVGVGRLVAQKSWGTLIEASRLVDHAQIVVAGQGPLLGELEATARAAGGRVRFLGHVEDVAALLGLATCVVSTSRWEGLPLSLLEALSLGVPAVATAVDGIVDLVPPHAAVLVPPEDPQAVAIGLGRVLSDRDLARELSEAARRAALAWAPETMLGAYRRTYGALGPAAAP